MVPTLAATDALIGAATLAFNATAPATGAARSASRLILTLTLSRSLSSNDPVVASAAGTGRGSTAAGDAVDGGRGAPPSTVSFVWSTTVACGACATASPEIN